MEHQEQSGNEPKDPAQFLTSLMCLSSQAALVFFWRLTSAELLGVGNVGMQVEQLGLAGADPTEHPVRGGLSVAAAQWHQF